MGRFGNIRVLLLAHDLSNAAVHRRAAMLRAGGAMVVVAGFRRTDEPITHVAGCAAIDLGRTFDGRFAQRIWSVAREAILLARRRALFTGIDVIIARNLEMLAIAVIGRKLCRPRPVLVYECLDIHRLLVDKGIIGNCMRFGEGWLARSAAALLTSSPAYVSHYFEPLSRVRLPVRVIENKTFEMDGVRRSADMPSRQPGPPWVIGWFGMMHCAQSLKILGELVQQSGGTIEAVLRGRPDRDQLEDFDRYVSETPGLRFLGPYTNPGDLGRIYSDVHFTWAIDLFGEGHNSEWLLPNRLYEGGAFGSVPIAMERVETGRFLNRLGIGVTIKEPLHRSLGEFFANLTPAGYRALESAVARVPRVTWVCGREDCKALVDYLRSLKHDADADSAQRDRREGSPV